MHTQAAMYVQGMSPEGERDRTTFRDKLKESDLPHREQVREANPHVCVCVCVCLCLCLCLCLRTCGRHVRNKYACVCVCVCVYVLAMVDEPRLYTSALTTDCQRRLMLTNQ